MKVYKVVYSKIKADEDEDILIIEIFLNKDLALNYFKRQVEETKEEFKETKNYKIKETENSYERALNGKTFEDTISIWLDEDDFYDEFELQLVKKRLQDEKDYEM